MAGHRRYLTENRRYLQTGASGIAANVLKREQRIATVSALIDYRKKNQVLPQTVHGRPRNRQRRRPGKRLILLKEAADGCSRVSGALGVSRDDLSQKFFSCVACARFIEGSRPKLQALQPTRTRYVHRPIRDRLQQLIQFRNPNLKNLWQKITRFLH
jgi:hypothetical protein